MNKIKFLSKVIILSIIITSALSKVSAQHPIVKLANESHTSNTYEFDVIITNNDTLNYYFFGMQTCFTFNLAVINGGTISKTVLNSDLPGSANYFNATTVPIPHYGDTIDPKIYTSAYAYMPFQNSYIIPSNQSILVYRLKFTNTVNWPSNTKFDIQYRLNQPGLYTRLGLYNQSTQSSYILDNFSDITYINNLANQYLDTTTILPQAVTVIPSSNPVTSGTNVNFTAITSPAIYGQQFEWKVNSVLQNTQGGNTYTYAPANGDKIIVKALPYANYAGGVSDTITMVVNPNPTDNIWLGNSDNWHDTTNWSLGVIPNSNQNVIIPVNTSNPANYPVLTSAAYCNKITFHSNQSGSGQIIDNFGFLNVSDINSNIYLSSNKWHFISSPVPNSSTSPLLTINPANPNQFNFLRTMLKPDTATFYWYHFIFYSGTNASIVQAGTQNMTPGKGFMFLSNVSAIYNLSGNYLNTNNVTASILGNQPSPVNKGYFLVGNPYQSALNISNFTSWQGFSNMYPSIWLFNNGNFQISNGSVGNITTIPVHQAFIVRNISSSAITIPKTAKTFGNIPLLKTTISNLLNLKVERLNDTSKVSDETFIRFMQNASLQFELNKDVEKLFGDYYAPQLFSKYNNVYYSINNLPDLQAGTTNVQLGFLSAVIGQFKFVADGLNSFENNISIFLEDTKTNFFTNLKINPEYAFTADSNDSENRFVLHFTTSTTVQNQDNNSINIFSNEKTIHIINPDNINIKEIAIYNMLGQMIKSVSNINSPNYKFTLHNASAGYIVKVFTDNAVLTKKVFIK